MTRDFSRSLTMMVAGSGNATRTHLEESLGEWIFPDPDADRDVRVILPVLAQAGGALRNLVKIGQEWGFEFIPVMVKNSKIPASLSFIDEDVFIYAADEREVLEISLSLTLRWHEQGNETAFVMAYNPDNTYEQGSNVLSDFEILGDAKVYPWLTTLNLCEGLIDSFEGYKSREELITEAAVQAKFALEQAAKTPVEEKPQAPRRRAVKKAVTPKVTKPVEEPQKPVQDPLEGPPGGLDEFAVPKTAEELGKMSIEACITQNIGPNPHRTPLPVDAVLSANVVLPKTKEVWDDVAEAHLQTKIKDYMVYVKKSDLSDLSEGIKDLTQSFGKIMDTFTRILKEK